MQHSGCAAVRLSLHRKKAKNIASQLSTLHNELIAMRAAVMHNLNQAKRDGKAMAKASAAAVSNVVTAHAQEAEKFKKQRTVS